MTGMFSGGSSQAQEAAPVQAATSTQQPMDAGMSSCDMDMMAFQQCVKQSDNNIGECQMFYDMFKQCMTKQQQQQHASSNGYSF